MNKKNSSVTVFLGLFVLSVFSLAQADSFSFAYPFANQIIAPGDHTPIQLQNSLSFDASGLPVDFYLVPTAKLSLDVKDVLVLSTKVSTSTFYFDVPKDILSRVKNVSTFQMIASRNGMRLAGSDVFKIASGVATTTVYLNGSVNAPKCSVDKTVVAPNDKVIFTPSSSYPGTYQFRWNGEASTTSRGAIPLSFIFPGNYTVTLEALSQNGALYKTSCPTIFVSFDNPKTTSATSSQAFYPFPFSSTTTKVLIPKEIVDYSTSPECLFIGQNLSSGYTDDVKDMKTGIIYKLQKFLQSKGFLKTNPSGYFGPMTVSAVKSFQRTNAIEATGFVGSVTREKIKAISCNL